MFGSSNVLWRWWIAQTAHWTEGWTSSLLGSLYKPTPGISRDRRKRKIHSHSITARVISVYRSAGRPRCCVPSTQLRQPQMIDWPPIEAYLTLALSSPTARSSQSHYCKFAIGQEGAGIERDTHYTNRRDFLTNGTCSPTRMRNAPLKCWTPRSTISLNFPKVWRSLLPDAASSSVDRVARKQSVRAAICCLAFLFLL